MLFLLWGASGSGKTTVMHALAPTLPTCAVHDFDEVGVPPDRDEQWRRETAEVWTQRALDYQAAGRHTLLSAQLPYGELLACPSAPAVDGIAGCLLDCDDHERIDRIRERGAGREAATQDTLCWASWLRMHACDPRWHQEVIMRGGSAMEWERWRSWKAGDPRWRTYRIDTTGASLHDTVDAVRAWLDRELQSDTLGLQTDL